MDRIRHPTAAFHVRRGIKKLSTATLQRQPAEGQQFTRVGMLHVDVGTRHQKSSALGFDSRTRFSARLLRTSSCVVYRLICEVVSIPSRELKICSLIPSRHSTSMNERRSTFGEPFSILRSVSSEIPRLDLKSDWRRP